MQQSITLFAINNWKCVSISKKLYILNFSRKIDLGRFNARIKFKNILFRDHLANFISETSESANDFSAILSVSVDQIKAAKYFNVIAPKYFIRQTIIPKVTNTVEIHELFNYSINCCKFVSKCALLCQWISKYKIRETFSF